MSPRTLVLVAASLLAFSCGAGEDLLVPSHASRDAAIDGLVRQRGQGDFLEFANETFEAVYEAETVRAPEWSVSGGELAVYGSSVRWQLPPAGEHRITLRLFLADGRQVDAWWLVTVRPREHRAAP